jgi:hypothetical protein
MHPISVPEFLNVWEAGLAASPLERALAILSVAVPESSVADLSRVSIGERDTALLQLREWAFGSELPILAVCPRCQNPLETVLLATDLFPQVGTASAAENLLTMGDHKFRYRPLNTEDLNVCAGMDLTTCRRALFARCVLESSRQGRTLCVDELPVEVVETVMERIAETDGADIQIDLTCPDCEHRWKELFDIVSFFWAEIDAWARRLLREVHILASVYGWKEGDVLALSPTRRQIYLAMAEA